MNFSILGQTIRQLGDTMDSNERLNNVIYRDFNDLKQNKNIQDSLIGYDRNRTPAVKTQETIVWSL